MAGITIASLYILLAFFTAQVISTILRERIDAVSKHNMAAAIARTNAKLVQHPRSKNDKPRRFRKFA